MTSVMPVQNLQAENFVSPMPMPDGVMKVKIDPVTGILIDESEEGIYEYFYHENPPPSVERPLPPMEEPDGTNFPDSMTDNPLQPRPPSSTPTNRPPPAAPRDWETPAEDPANAAARMMNPSGY